MKSMDIYVDGVSIKSCRNQIYAAEFRDTLQQDCRTAAGLQDCSRTAGLQQDIGYIHDLF